VDYEFDASEVVEWGPRIEPPSVVGKPIAEVTRDQRQLELVAWAKAAFGVEQATSIPQRGLRFMEEAVELFQAVGGDLQKAHELVDFVFERPIGELGQEFGGVAVTVLLLAAAGSVRRGRGVP
jgi:hypothetical protein